MEKVPAFISGNDGYKTYRIPAFVEAPIGDHISISVDGGASWDTTYFDMTLSDTVNEGSILALGKNTIAFSNAADENRRDNLTLRISFDEGRTWK